MDTKAIITIPETIKVNEAFNIANAYQREDITMKINEKEVNELLNTDFEEPTNKPSEESFLYDVGNGKLRVCINTTANYIKDQKPIKTIWGTKNETCWVYNKGVWKPNGREYIKTMTEELINDHCKTNTVNEIYDKIKRTTNISWEQFNKTPIGKVCLKNGVYDFKTMTLEEHNPNYYFKSQIPIKYNKKAKCPTIMNFFEQTFYPEDLPIIQEWIGFQLFNQYFIKKAVILFGEKDTGKTVFLNLLTTFIGKPNCAGLSLQQISNGNTFSKACLKDKYANIFDDLSSTDIMDNGGFKIATGGGYITGEVKFGDQFQFLNYAKHTFACNKIPNVKEVEDDAYFSRWIPIPLDNQVPNEDRDTFLINKLTAETELSGLLNWAIEGLKRLLKKGGFSYDKTCQEIKTIMTRHGNSLVAFSQDCLKRDDGHEIVKRDLYEVYTKYCQLTDRPRMSYNQVSRSLSKITGYVTAKRDSSGKTRVWSNVSVNKRYFFEKSDLKSLEFLENV